MSSEKKKYKPRTSVVKIDAGGIVPPQAVDLEDAVLGGILTEGKFINKVMGEFDPELFYDDRNQLVAEAIVQLYRENKPIDTFSVIQRLKTNRNIDEVGGAFRIAQLTAKLSSIANVEYYLKILQQEALKRKIIQVCGNALSDAYNPNIDVFETFQYIQKNLDVSYKSVVKHEVFKIGDVHESVIREQIKVTEQGIASGVPTGLRQLDKVTNGWQKSDFIILAGRPSMGKTSAALSMVAWPAIKKNIPVAIFSLEMSKEQLVGRFQSMESGIDASKITKKQLTLEEITRISMEGKTLETAPIFIDDTPSISLIELKAKARRLVLEHGVEEIIIDYLQLMKSGLNIVHREQEIAEISRGLKALAKELNIPIIALSQLNRVVETRPDKKPIMSDLRESGQIEQDADLVVFCYRPEYYNIEQYEVGNNVFDTNGLFMLLIAKHRNGSLGEIPLKFVHQQALVVNHDYQSHNNSYAEPTPRPEPPEQEKKPFDLYTIGQQIAGIENKKEETPF